MPGLPFLHYQLVKCGCWKGLVGFTASPFIHMHTRSQNTVKNVIWQLFNKEHEVVSLTHP